MTTIMNTESAITFEATMAFDDPLTVQPCILIVNQAMYINELANHQVCLMMCNLNGAIINDALKFLQPSKSVSDHVEVL